MEEQARRKRQAASSNLVSPISKSNNIMIINNDVHYQTCRHLRALVDDLVSKYDIDSHNTLYVAWIFSASDAIPISDHIFDAIKVYAYN